MSESWFVAVIHGIVFLTNWIGVQNVAVACLAFDFGYITFFYKFPAVFAPFIAMINIIAFANTFFYDTLKKK